MPIRKVTKNSDRGYSPVNNLNFCEIELAKICLITGLDPEKVDNYVLDDFVAAIKETFSFTNFTSESRFNNPSSIHLRKYQYFLIDHCKFNLYWRHMARYEKENG